MEKRRDGRRSASTTEVVTETLDATEEKVIRMRVGNAAPDDLVLEQVGQDHSATRKKLREMELRALEKSGRLKELREEVGLEARDTDQAVKAKIISGLKQSAEKPATPRPKKRKRKR